MYWNLQLSVTVATTGFGLTLTWDVLKFNKAGDNSIPEKININMRCIEITTVSVECEDILRININMRCIEIINGSCNHIYVSGLTLTWDVLK